MKTPLFFALLASVALSHTHHPDVYTTGLVVHQPESYPVGDQRSELLDSLRNEIAELNRPMPGNFGQFCINTATQGSFDIQRTDEANLDSVLDRWNLPQQVREFLSNIKYADEATHHSLSFVLSHDHSSIEEYVVSGKNNNGEITVSYIHSYSHGAVVQQYLVIHSCHKTLFHKKCHDDFYPRDLNTDEIMVIQNGLMSIGYGFLLSQVDQMRNSL